MKTVFKRDFTKPKKVLLCLSGGGFRMLECACGVFQALEKADIRPSNYLGASAGAISAGFHASGVSGLQMENIIRSKPASSLMSSKLWPLFVPFMKASSLYKRDGMEKLIRQIVMPLITNTKVKVSVTEVSTKKSVMLNGYTESILASSAIPEVFEPVNINGIEYVDGGVKNNIPLPRIIEINNWDLIIIVLCPPSTDNLPIDNWFKSTRAKDWLEATMDREFNQVLETWQGVPNTIIIQPPEPTFETSLLDWSENFKLINYCREYTLGVL